MKDIAKNAAVAILVTVLIVIAEFLVTLPFGEPEFTVPESYRHYVNLEYLLTAIPAFFISAGISRLMKTVSKRDSLRRGLTWAAVLALTDTVIGIGNENFFILFGTFGIYLKYICTAAGPALFQYLRKAR